MKLLKWTTVVLVSLFALAFAFKQSILLHLPGVINHLKNPVAPHRAIQWSPPPADLKPSPINERPPNVVLIIADDLGWNDISLNGGVANGALPTPSIDALAKNGVNFTQGYTADGTCAPSRAAIMTGRYGTRFGFEGTPTVAGMAKVFGLLMDDVDNKPATIFDEQAEANLLPFEQLGMPSSEVTIAEMLKKMGYQTGHIGKWHLGRGQGMLPHQQGFDDALLMASGMYLPADDPNSVGALQESNVYNQFQWSFFQYAASFNGLEFFEPNGYITDYYTDEAVNFININKDRPFFLNLAHWAPHAPIQALKADYDALAHIQDHTTRVYGAMIKALDRSVNRVTQALKDNGLEENTLVIFVSDNGATNQVNVANANAPYRGWKITFFEGGIRTPFFVKWPAQLQKGKQVSEMVHHTDIFTTIAAAVGATLPNDRKLDGKNLLPHAKGEKTGALHDALFWKHAGYQAVISDGWKLHRSERQNKIWLYNLNLDPSEQTNLANAHPEKVQALSTMLAQYNDEIMEPRWPSVLEAPVNIDKLEKEGWAPGDEFIYYPN